MTLIIETEIPNWVKWVAQDSDGAWYGYSAKPSQSSHQWNCDISRINITKIGDSGKRSRKWKDTLHEVVVEG